MQNEEPEQDSTSTTSTAVVEPINVSLPTRIRVVVRVRPQLALEKNHACNILKVHQQRNLVSCSSSSIAKSFQFDQVFDGNTTQRAFYEQLGVERMLSALLDGYHATIFAYGQTGSGKTFTMEGYDYETNPTATSNMPQARFDTSANSDRIGLIPRVIFNLFDQLNRVTKSSTREFTIKCSFLQIYNEQILDLLNPSQFQASRKGKRPIQIGKPGSETNSSLRLRWSSVRDFYVENLTLLECSSPEQVLGYFQNGIKHKIMASHNLNAASSRSHCVFTLYVESIDSVDGEQTISTSKLALVDLAGSERVDKTGATGVTLQESIGINKSLFVLRQVIQALSEASARTSSIQDSYIPHRDSKLTSLLKYALGGNSWTLMIACLSPSDQYIEENMSTLTYASKAQSIQNQPIKNEDPKSIMIHMLRQEIETLRKELAQAHDVILQFQQADGSRSSESSKPENTTIVTSDDTSTKTSTNSSQVATTRLQQHVIDNVELIKQLYATERQLHNRVADQEERIQALIHETRVLNVENQSLREKIDVLEYLVVTQKDEAMSNQEKEEAVEETGNEEIPEYGTLVMKSSKSVGSLPPRRPPPDRIDTALQTKPTRPLPLEKPSTAQTSSTKAQNETTGLLSLSELRDLLSGKKLNSATPSPQPPSSQPVHRSSRIRAISQPDPQPKTPQHHHSQNPTTSILTTLQHQSNGHTNTIENDPLDALSELNRLLRVKATLRRSSATSNSNIT